MDKLKTVRITLVKSPIGYTKRQKETVRALGLKKVLTSREVVLTPQVQGMINRVQHLLLVEDVEDSPQQKEA